MYDIQCTVNNQPWKQNGVLQLRHHKGNELNNFKISIFFFVIKEVQNYDNDENII